MNTETRASGLRRFSLLFHRHPQENHLERKVGLEKPERVLVTYISRDRERSFIYEGTLRERKIQIGEIKTLNPIADKQTGIEINPQDFTYEYELVHPNSRQPQFFHTSIEVFDTGQLPFNETPEGIRVNRKMKRNILMIVNGLVIAVDFAIILKAPFAYGSGSFDLFYLPASLAIFFSMLTYFLVRRERGHTLVRNPILFEVVASPDYRYAVPVNANVDYLQELQRLTKMDKTAIEKIGTLLTNTNSESTAVDKLKLETQEESITNLTLELRKERQKRAEAIARGFEVQYRLPLWSKLTMVALGVTAVGVPLFLLFG